MPLSSSSSTSIAPRLNNKRLPESPIEEDFTVVRRKSQYKNITSAQTSDFLLQSIKNSSVPASSLLPTPKHQNVVIVSGLSPSLSVLEFARILKSKIPCLPVVSAKRLHSQTGFVLTLKDSNSCDKLLSLPANSLGENVKAYKPKPRQNITNQHQLVLLGVDPSITKIEIEEDLQMTVPSVTNVEILCNRSTQKPNGLVRLTISDQSVYSNLLRNGLFLFGIVHYQTAIATPKAVVKQCGKCFSPTHLTFQCKVGTKCLRCGSLNHTLSSCQVEKATPVCANCGEQHVATYKGCKVLKAPMDPKLNRTFANVVSKPRFLPYATDGSGTSILGKFPQPKPAYLPYATDGSGTSLLGKLPQAKPSYLPYATDGSGISLLGPSPRQPFSSQESTGPCPPLSPRKSIVPRPLFPPRESMSSANYHTKPAFQKYNNPTNQTSTLPYTTTHPRFHVVSSASSSLPRSNSQKFQVRAPTTCSKVSKIAIPTSTTEIPNLSIPQTDTVDFGKLVAAIVHILQQIQKATDPTVENTLRIIYSTISSIFGIQYSPIDIKADIASKLKSTLKNNPSLITCFSTDV